MRIGMYVALLGGAISVYIMMAYGLKEYRNRRSSILMLFSCIALYELAMFLVEKFEQEYGLLVEIFSLWILCTVFLKGCIWRNFFFIQVSFYISNILFFIVCSVNDLMANIYYKEEMGYRVTVWEGAIDAGICSISSIIAVTVLRPFFKGKYRGNGRIYKIVVILYIALMFFQTYIRKVMTKNAGDLVDIKKDVMVIVVMFSFIVAGCLVLIYDYFEKKRIARERETLKNLIREAYRDLNTSGEGLPALVRTGNIVMDSVLSAYTTVFEEQGVIFENDIEPLKDMEFEEKGIVAIIDNLLGMASEGKDKSDNTFVKLSLRNVKGAIIIKIETSKDIIQGKKVFSRSMRSIRDRFNFIKEICDMQDSIISEKKLDEECEIAIVMI